MTKFYKKDVAVLDVTSRVVSAIVGRKKSDGSFNVRGFCEREHFGYADGEWIDEKNFEQQLAEALKGISSYAKKIKRLYVSVPAEFGSVVTRTAIENFPHKRRISDADIDALFQKGLDFEEGEYRLVDTSAIYFAINNESKLYSDVRGMDADSIEVCASYMLAKKSYIKLIDEYAKAAGFIDVRYVLTEWAEVMGLVDPEVRDNVFILLDIGYLSSSMTIAKGDGIIEMKSFSMGGAHIAADIYEYLEVPFDMAEDSKRLIDLNLNYTDKDIIVSNGDHTVYAIYAAQIVKARLDMFAEVIRGVLKEINTSPLVINMYLTGEGISSLRGARRYLSDSLIRYIDLIAPKLANFDRPEHSSKACLIEMALNLSNNSAIGSIIKKLFNGGKNNELR